MEPTRDDERQPAQANEDDGRGPAWERLEDQLGWYDGKSVTAQRMYKRVKLSQLIVGAVVPVVAGLRVSAPVTATLAALVVVAEGAQQLYQWQTTWVLYRSTAEALKHEKYLYLAAAGPYSTEDRHRVLAERLEGLISQEHATWTESRQRERHTSAPRAKHI
ncbi:MAG: DUF4231 domain-containing protein [Pseudonocardiaceae bacterium]